MANPHTGTFMLPGIESLRTNVEKEIWWGRWEQQLFQPAVILGTARDTGNTNNTERLRPGLLLGKVTASGKLKEWNPTGIDGSQIMHGVLVYSQTTQFFNSDKDRWIGYVQVGGNLKSSSLLVPGSTTFGLSGNANEHIIRGQLDNRFLFDDDLSGSPMWGFNNIIAKTGNYTVTEADNGTMFTNRGATGGVVFTLPVTPEKGLTYSFFTIADFLITVAGGTANNMVYLNDATASDVGFEVAGELIGSAFTVIGDGVGWLTIPHVWDTVTAQKDT